MARPDCPDCGSPLPYKAESCRSCGWSKAGTKIAPDVDGMRCSWIADGRCQYAGTISPNTTGGGPWYCTGHYGCDDAVHGQRIVDESRRNVKTRSWTAMAMREASKAALMARPIPPIPPTPAGVRFQSVGTLKHVAEVAERHARLRREDDDERSAIETEGTA